MKITKKLLEKLIKEEVKKAARLNEGVGLAIDIKGLDFWPVVQKLNYIARIAQDALDHPKAQNEKQLDLDPVTINMFKEILRHEQDIRDMVMKYSKEHP